ncbi:MAG: hypothetical protein IKL03_06035 [Bacteroidaceae bacterium]|nr:hypothetical protein [Bacteroidaceae bacterium]MBR6629501.1 hypothetical protein [Bacteroidaceae bacterium]
MPDEHIPLLSVAEEAQDVEEQVDEVQIVTVCQSLLEQKKFLRTAVIKESEDRGHPIFAL